MRIDNLRNLVDELGALKAQASDLDNKIKAIVAVIKTEGIREIDGDLYRATLSVSERLTLDADAIHEILANPPMKSTLVETVRVVARCNT